MERSVGLERAATSKIKEVATDAGDGELYTSLGNNAATQVIIYNFTGETLLVGFLNAAGTGLATGQVGLPVADGTAQPLRGIANTNQVGVRREDGSDTPVTVQFVLEGVV